MSISIKKDAWQIKDQNGNYRSTALFSTMLPNEAQQLIIDTRAEFTNLESETNEIIRDLENVKQEILDLEDDAKASIISTRTIQNNLITTLANKEIQNIYTKGQETLASIPQNYVDLANLANLANQTANAAFIYNSISDNIINFDDGVNGMLIKSLVANIEPTQDYNGYDHPWPAGTGKNLLSCVRNDQVLSNVNLTWSSDGLLHLSGSPSGNFRYDLNGGNSFLLPAGTYYLSGKHVPSNPSGNTYLALRTNPGNSSTNVAVNNVNDTPKQFTLNTATEVYPIIYVQSTTTISGECYYAPMIYSASDNITEYEPYENMCPITGHTSVTVSHSGADTSNPETISVNWQTAAGTVYGGIINVVSGKLSVKYRKYTFDGVGTVADGLSFAKGSSSSVLMYYSLSSSNSPLITTQATDVYVNDLKCSHFPFGTTTVPNSAFVVQGQLCVALSLDDSRNTAELFNTWVKEQHDNGTPLEIVAELSQPNEVQLTPQEVECFLGVNNIWADTGDVTVTYPVDTKTYIDKKIQEAISGLSGS